MEYVEERRKKKERKKEIKKKVRKKRLVFKIIIYTLFSLSFNNSTNKNTYNKTAAVATPPRLMGEKIPSNAKVRTDIIIAKNCAPTPIILQNNTNGCGGRKT